MESNGFDASASPWPGGLKRGLGWPAPPGVRAARCAWRAAHRRDAETTRLGIMPHQPPGARAAPESLFEGSLAPYKKAGLRTALPVEVSSFLRSG